MEWNVNYAYIIDPNGNKICDFSTNNLHLIGYSESIEVDLQLSDLQDHLYSLPEQPDAIPYITSYYEQRWGFCISERQRQKLLEGIYKIRISTSKTMGTLDIGEYLELIKRKYSCLLISVTLQWLIMKFQE